MRFGDAHRRVFERRERLEPLHRAAARIVLHLFVDGELHALRHADLDVILRGRELDRRDVDANDLRDQPARHRAHETDQRVALRRRGARIDGDDRFHRGRLFAAHLAHAEVAIAGDGRGHRQAVERHAFERSRGDPPRHDRLAAHGLGLAVHDAAAGKHLGRARLDVFTGDARVRLRRESRHADATSIAVIIALRMIINFLVDFDYFVSVSFCALCAFR